MEFTAFIDFMRGPGINAIIGILLSFAVEWFPNFSTLAPRTRRLIMLGLCLVVPTVGTLLGVLTGHLVSNFELVWWPGLVAGGTAFGASMLAGTRGLVSNKTWVAMRNTGRTSLTKGY